MRTDYTNLIASGHSSLTTGNWSFMVECHDKKTGREGWREEKVNTAISAIINALCANEEEKETQRHSKVVCYHQLL